MEVGICRFEDEEGERWDAYVQRAAGAGHCHLSGWKRVMETSYRHRGCYLWALENGTVKGVLPLVLMQSLYFGRSLVSLPFLDDGGICADDEATARALYRAAGELFDAVGAELLELRHRKPSPLALPPQGAKVTLALALAEDPDRMWARFDAKLRNQVRKALRSGLTVHRVGSDGLPGFYDVFASNMRDLGSPTHSRRFFEAILEAFPASARLLLVRADGRTIGGGLCLLFRDTLLMPWASSLRRYFPRCPNNLLYWEAIRWGCEQGFRRFDFGRSSPGSGTYRFKQQWGAVEEPLHWEGVRRDHRASTLQADDPKYRWAVETWRRLPLRLTRLIGPVLRRHISN